MRCIACWHFQWHWQTPNPVVKITTFLKSISKTKGQSFYSKPIGNHTQSIEWYHFQWPWVTSDQDFKVTTFFEVEYRKDKDKAIIAKEETTPNIGDLDWPLNVSRGFVSISWACLSQVKHKFNAWKFISIFSRSFLSKILGTSKPKLSWHARTILVWNISFIKSVKHMRKLGLTDACQRLAYADGFPNFTLDSGIAMPAFDEVSYLLDDQSPSKTLMQQLLRYLSRYAQQVHQRSITTVRT